MSEGARSVRRPLRVVAPLVVAAFVIIGVGVIGVVGAEPSQPSPIPDVAFRPVLLTPGAPTAPVQAIAPARTPELDQITEPWVPSAPPDRARPTLPGSDVVVVVKPRPTPKPTPRPQPASGASGGGSSGGGTSSGGSNTGSTSGGTSTSHTISGRASYYCWAGSSPCTYNHPDGPGFDAYAAAGPKLRAAIGSTWRGTVVLVDGIRVKLIDWCQCYKGEPHEKLLDLYHDVFARVGSSVTIRW